MDSHAGGATEGHQAEPQPDEPRVWLPRDVHNATAGDTPELPVC